MAGVTARAGSAVSSSSSPELQAIKVKMTIKENKIALISMFWNQ